MRAGPLSPELRHVGAHPGFFRPVTGSQTDRTGPDTPALGPHVAAQIRRNFSSSPCIIADCARIRPLFPEVSFSRLPSIPLRRFLLGTYSKLANLRHNKFCERGLRSTAHVVFSFRASILRSMGSIFRLTSKRSPRRRLCRHRYVKKRPKETVTRNVLALKKRIAKKNDKM